MPDACLINRYVAGTRLSLHQDRDEPDLSAPIVSVSVSVSVSLGLPATFLFGGPVRTDPVRRIRLAHGDVVVWAVRRGWRSTASRRCGPALIR